MNHIACFFKSFVLAILLGCVVAVSHAADLPLAAASPLTGVAFDDKPLSLPVQRNFQMAMLTAGSEMGRSCGRIEAYGWRMNQNEQARVNQIFNNTVDHLRSAGYAIQPQKLTSVANDITLFTADGKDRHFIFLWSAGELGLVMTTCETSAPLPQSQLPQALAPSVQIFPVADDVVSSHLDTVGKFNNGGKFSPLGHWVGGYTCAQGYTGGTLRIDHIRGQDFDGVFTFYPTRKNPLVPHGSYAVYGQYDHETQRILINPGQWLQRPKNFYNTVIVGSFDATHDTLSAYFQGISGCTSFEAKRLGEPFAQSVAKKARKAPRQKITHKIRQQIPLAAPDPVQPAVAPSPVSAAPASATVPASASTTATPDAVIPAPISALPAGDKPVEGINLPAPQTK